MTAPFQDFGRSLCESGILSRVNPPLKVQIAAHILGGRNRFRKFCIVKPRPKLGLTSIRLSPLFVLAMEASIGLV